MCLVLMDFITGVVVDVLPDRKKDSLIRYLSDIKNKTYDPKTHRSELDNVKFISIDLTDNFRILPILISLKLQFALILSM